MTEVPVEIGSAERKSVNYAAISSVLASVVAWLGLYALYADFGTLGVDLMQQADALAKLEGVALLSFEAVGILLSVALASGIVAVAVALGVGGPARERSAGN
jgi:hypothetical protein